MPSRPSAPVPAGHLSPEGRIVRLHFAQVLLEASAAYAQAVADNIGSEVARLEHELGALVGPLQMLAADSTGAPLRFGDVVECLVGPQKGQRAVVVADEHLRHDDENGRERLGPGPNARAIVGLVVEGQPTTTIHLLVRSDHDDGTPFWRRVLATPVPMSDNGSTPGSAGGDGRPSEDLARGGVRPSDGRPSASTDVRHEEGPARCAHGLALNLDCDACCRYPRRRRDDDDAPKEWCHPDAIALNPATGRAHCVICAGPARLRLVDGPGGGVDDCRNCADRAGCASRRICFWLEVAGEKPTTPGAA
jgi:hypothetical protein